MFICSYATDFDKWDGNCNKNFYVLLRSFQCFFCARNALNLVKHTSIYLKLAGTEDLPRSPGAKDASGVFCLDPSTLTGSR